MRSTRSVLAATLVGLISLACPQRSEAYGLSTHILLVDLLWDSSIVPVIRAEYGEQADWPSIRRYAYSGALIQDAGYYVPILVTKRHKQKLAQFSDYVHYARSGDFVSNLFARSHTAEELAFAIGAATHYVGDIVGHHDGTNRAVPRSAADPRFPLLETFRGQDSVNYSQSEDIHKAVEFGFDINAAKLGRLRPVSLKEASNLSLQSLTYAFYLTYGLDKDYTLKKQGLDYRAFYKNADGRLPSATYAQASKYGSKVYENTDSLQKLIDTVKESRQWPSGVSDGPFIYRAFVGKIKQAEYITPTEETQTLYADSVVKSIGTLRSLLDGLRAEVSPAVKNPIPKWPGAECISSSSDRLPNLNLDTGESELGDTYSYSVKVHQTWLDSTVSGLDPEHPWPVPTAALMSLRDYYATSPNAATIDAQLNKVPPNTSDSCPDETNYYGWGKYGYGWGANVAENYPSIQPLCERQKN